MSAVPKTITGSATIYTPAAGASGVGRLLGWSIRESAGVAAVATVLIRAGTTDTAPIIAAIELAANGSSTEWLGPQGVQARDGIRVQVVAGTVEGAVYIQ